MFWVAQNGKVDSAEKKEKLKSVVEDKKEKQVEEEKKNPKKEKKYPRFIFVKVLYIIQYIISIQKKLNKWLKIDND